MEHLSSRCRRSGAYAAAGVFRGTLKRPGPLEISLDLGELTPR